MKKEIFVFVFVWKKIIITVIVDAMRIDEGVWVNGVLQCVQRIVDIERADMRRQRHHKLLSKSYCCLVKNNFTKERKYRIKNVTNQCFHDIEVKQPHIRKERNKRSTHYKYTLPTLQFDFFQKKAFLNRYFINFYHEDRHVGIKWRHNSFVVSETQSYI